MNSPVSTNNNISYMPIGGLNDVGGNLSLFKINQISFLVDLGIEFENLNAYGINHSFPNLDELKIKPDFIIFTHAHDDHIGAVNHYKKLLKNTKIYAPKFAIQLLKNKFSFPLTNIHEISEDFTLKADGFKIKFIKVNHSTPDTYALSINIEKDQKHLLFLTDFKIDEENSFEKSQILDKINKIKEKNKYLFIDSTNSLKLKSNLYSEDHIKNDLNDIISNNHERIFITTFSSNIERIYNISKIAEQNKRDLVIYGRSLEQYIVTSYKANIISKINFKTPDKVKNLDADAIILVTGSQGEYRSSLMRIAQGEDKYFTLNEKDTVVFSSKVIPGNEIVINSLLDKISNFNSNILTTKDKKVHVSGHPDLEMINKVITAYRPKHIIPIHGGPYLKTSLIKHFKSIYNKINFILLKNFSEYSLSDNSIINHTVSNEKLFSTNENKNITYKTLKQRIKIARKGLLIININAQNSDYSIKHFGVTCNADDHDKIIHILEKSLNHNALRLEEIIKSKLKKELKIKPELIINNY